MFNDNHDSETGDSIRRLERQLRLEGKLEQSEAVEGLSLLLLPVVLIVVGGLNWFLQDCGANSFTSAIITIVILSVGVFLYATRNE